jgi:hypothetical protein
MDASQFGEKTGNSTVQVYPYIRFWRSAARAQVFRSIRFPHQPKAHAILSITVARASPLFHNLGSDRMEQHDGVFCLRRPVTDWIHVHVRVSGGSSTGSFGSRLTCRALGGVALGLTSLLSGMHSDLNLTGTRATFTHPPFASVGEAEDHAHADDFRPRVKSRRATTTTGARQRVESTPLKS